jgi:hypothetical protein
VAPLLEMPLEGTWPPVAEVAADFALVLDVEAVQLVKPVRDGFACRVANAKTVNPRLSREGWVCLPSRQYRDWGLGFGVQGFGV